MIRFGKISVGIAAASAVLAAGVNAEVVKLIYTSDPHYAITRARFQQTADVDAQTVNRAMIRTMNALPAITLPDDAGVSAGSPVGAIDYLVQTGDIANRQEASKSFQSDSASWGQFIGDYTDSVTFTGRDDQAPTLLLSPGNHDVSNAIGYYKTLAPLTDPTSMVEIYNRMMEPATPLTNAGFDYATDKINYSRDIAGVHFMFVNMWPDSANRLWMEEDLAGIDSTVPVIIFTHDQPDVESKHLSNPNAAGTINSTDKFENLVAEHLKDGLTTSSASVIEQQGFADFLKVHHNIRAYFHGNDNRNEFYTWTGPADDVALPTYRVDSPMKGSLSGIDAGDGIGNETLLSYQLIVIDSATQLMTVREILWNTDSTDATAPSVFGESKTISLSANPITSIASAAQASLSAGAFSVTQSGAFATIAYAIPAGQSATIRLATAQGRIVKSVAVNGGSNSIAVDGRSLASGLYIVSLNAGAIVQNRAILFNR